MNQIDIERTAFRSRMLGGIRSADEGAEVELAGWVHRRRDLGGLVFLDLRDRSGLVQVSLGPDWTDAASLALAHQLGAEDVVAVVGSVVVRPSENQNPDIPTGEIEVRASVLRRLTDADTPAIPVYRGPEDELPSEELRLKHRELDLRRTELQENLQLRHRLILTCRNYLDRLGFIEVETPILTKPTPEGARDYLVPSRTHEGNFFALPQSPQLFKQLLMMSGMDRYYQIVRCFRDEDLRADRQPEFTQLDIETSFMDEEQIMTMMEEMMRQLFRQVLDVQLPDPFPRMTYVEAMQRYASDKPDLRISLELVDIGDLLTDVEFKVFSAPANDPAGRIAALRLPQGGSLSRKEIDEYTKFVGIYGARGLAYIKVNDAANGREGLQSPILKFLPDAAIDGIMERTAAKTGDLIFFGADKAKVVNESLGALRVKLGHDRSLVEKRWSPLWVVDFPMFERDEKARHWHSLHHPFTSPKEEHIDLLESDPGACHSRAYDMILNGTELGGGSMRIYREEVQKTVFRALGIEDQEARDKFGFLLDALKYGCPPHGGVAFGLDRLVMLMSGASSIRDVMAFPKTQSASCLLTQAPSVVSDAQLLDLGIRLRGTVLKT